MLKLYIQAREFVAKFDKDEGGASLAEYALLIALVLIGASVAVVALTTAVSGAIESGATCLAEGVACGA